MRFTITDIHVTSHGGVAWVICTENIETKAEENIQQSRIEATNIFEKRDGLWKMVLHHGSPVLINASIS